MRFELPQAKYVVDHKGEYGTFRQLFEEGYLDKRFNNDTPHNRGYVFVMNLLPRSEKKAPNFSVNANPEQSEGIGATGGFFYYIDPESGICYSKLGPATGAEGDRTPDLMTASSNQAILLNQPN